MTFPFHQNVFDFEPKMASKWIQNGYQNPGMSYTFRVTLPRRLQGAQMDAKELENGSKMDPKSMQLFRSSHKYDLHTLCYTLACLYRLKMDRTNDDFQGQFRLGFQSPP